MQVQELKGTSGICFADFSVEMCKVVASYYLMNASINGTSNNTDLSQVATDAFNYWVSECYFLLLQ